MSRPEMIDEGTPDFMVFEKAIKYLKILCFTGIAYTEASILKPCFARYAT
jgi:hypothetical protein